MGVFVQDIETDLNIDTTSGMYFPFLLKIHAGPALFLGNKQHFLIFREALMLLTGPCESTENHFIY